MHVDIFQSTGIQHQTSSSDQILEVRDEMFKVLNTLSRMDFPASWNCESEKIDFLHDISRLDFIIRE